MTGQNDSMCTTGWYNAQIPLNKAVMIDTDAEVYDRTDEERRECSTATVDRRFQAPCPSSEHGYYHNPGATET